MLTHNFDRTFCDVHLLYETIMTMLCFTLNNYAKIMSRISLKYKIICV